MKKLFVIALISFFIVIFLVCLFCFNYRVVIANKFPDYLHIEEFLFAEKHFLKCGFAEVALSSGSQIPLDEINQTSANLNQLMRAHDQEKFIFPAKGYAYFRGKSILDLTALEGGKDGSLGYRIGEHIFSSRECWDKLRKNKKWEKLNDFSSLALKSNGIVIVKNDYYHTTIIFFPENRRAYYFGP